MSTHATYSPSSADRWMACPGSVDASFGVEATDSEHNEYTASGSTIHAIGEMILRTVFLDKEDYRPILDHALTETWGYYVEELPPEFATLPVTLDMIDQVETYLHEVRNLLDEPYNLGIEKRLTYNEQLFGTADLVDWNDERILICDLKTGSGNMVSPQNNKQLMTYAGMYLHNCVLDYPPYPRKVTLAIIQPPDEERPLKTWDTDIQTIEKHMEEVRDAMMRTDLNAGKHCRWCPVRASCHKLHELATNAMSLDLDGLTPEGWKDALDMAVILKPWCEQVFGRAHQHVAENGLNIPGWKLVQKVGRLNWASETEAEYAINEALDEADVDLLETPTIHKPATLLTPLQVKKALKGIVDAEFIDDLAVRKSSGTILVPENDKRPAVETGENLLDAARQVEMFK
jgi:hypothetical protein